MKFIITGNPCSSKNAIRSGITKQGRNYTYTKKNIKDYKDNGLKELKEQMNNYDISYPITDYVEVSFKFYVKDLRKRDLVNLCQMPCDLLQNSGIISNDYLIISLDGSRIVGVDAEPRTEIEIKIKDNL